MTIYDVKFYAAFKNKKVKLYATCEEAEREGLMVAYEVSFKRGGPGKKYVLELFATLCWKTMYLAISDRFCYDDGKWKYREELIELPEQFFMLYDKLYAAQKKKSIYDMIFYGTVSKFDIVLGQKELKIYSECTPILYAIGCGNEVFLARVLKSYDGKSDVVQVNSEGPVDYILLHKPNTYLGHHSQKWEVSEAPSSIPLQIIKCYKQYLRRKNNN